MKLNLRLAVWVAVPAVLIGLLVGVAIGRTRAPFGLAPSLALEDSETEQPLQTESSTPMSVSELKTLLAGGQLIALIDVREPDEYTAVHIPNSKSVPLGAIWAHEDEIPRDRPVVVYCSGDLRGEIAARELRKLGYTNVRYLDGGLSAWQNAGLVVAR